MNNFNDFKYNNINQNQNNNLMSNENFITMANSIDLSNLNGTNLMTLQEQNTPQFNMQPNNISSGLNINQDKHLIKSITQELINNLKENNISLHDDTSMNYLKNKTFDSNINNEHDNYSEDIKIKKSKKTKKNKELIENLEYEQELQKGLEYVMTENGIPASSKISSYIFDDWFNYKEFIILFGVYFLLSQEMIQDLFAQYFTSLNPDNETGKIHVKGVIIYGLILTVSFIILKKIIL
jgi:hypothetical protein